MAKKNNAVQIICFIIGLLVFIGAIGGLSFLTNNFTTEPATLFVDIDGKVVKGSTDEIIFNTQKTMFKVTNLSGQGYDVKIIPSVNDELDFAYKLNGKEVWYSNESQDFTKCFDIEYLDNGFSIDFANLKMSEILQTMYPQYTVSDVPDMKAGSYFTLVIIDKGNENNQLRIALNNILNIAVTGVEIQEEILL